MYRQHRERFLELLERHDAAALVVAGTPPLRNGDCEHRFRPASDFWYLTGFREPEAFLVLAPRREEGRCVLFLRDKDREQEIWSGRRLGVEAAPEALGVDEALPVESLWDELPELLEGHERLVHAAGVDERLDRRVERTLTALRGRAGRGTVAPSSRRSH